MGDFAYCFDQRAKKFDDAKFRWLVAWGFQAAKAANRKQPALQAFVCIENDYDGTLLPPPPAKERNMLWRRRAGSSLNRYTMELIALFLKLVTLRTFSAEDLLRGP